MNNEPEYISVSEASKIIKVGKDTIYKLAKQPGFPCVKIGKRYIINKGKLFEWVESHEGKEIIL